MRTVVINVDTPSSAKLLLELAKKLNFKARLLSDTQKEDIALLSIMESRKDEVALPVSKAYDTLRKIR